MWFSINLDNIQYITPTLWSNVYQHGLCLGLLCRSLQVKSVLLTEKVTEWFLNSSTLDDANIRALCTLLFKLTKKAARDI